MTQTAKRNRVIFLDLIRAFAVLNMVQGHTIDVLLSKDYRSLDYLLYGIWNFNRGMTAPLFMFTAGTTFTYLFRIQSSGFTDNPRFAKGFKRAMLLLFTGYLIKLPTGNPLYILDVPEKKWELFFAADVLQIISFGLLFLLLYLYLAERFKIKDIYLLGTGVLITTFLAPVVLNISWTDYLPLSAANYLYMDHGSLFTIFPWLAYILAGGILGSYLAKAGRIQQERNLGVTVSVSGLVMLLAALLSELAEVYITGNSTFWMHSPALVFLRLGLVLIVTALFIFISIGVRNIPKVIVLLGRNTLIIYVVHLVILYGSPWSAGINRFVGYTFTPLETVTAALVMFGLMIAMVIVFNKLNFKNRQLVTS